MKHQKATCHGELFHREDRLKDWYKCAKCGATWTKGKRQPA